jgi:hypothetical protein
MCFYGFEKNVIFAKNALVLAHGFIEDRQFVAKTN